MGEGRHEGVNAVADPSAALEPGLWRAVSTLRGACGGGSGLEPAQGGCVISDPLQTRPQRGISLHLGDREPHMGVSRLLVGEGPPALWSSQRGHRPGLPRSPLLPTRGGSAGISVGNQRVGLLELVVVGSRGLGG